MDLKTASSMDFSAILRKFFAEVKTESLSINEFISANKMFEARAKLFTKQCKTKTQIIYSVRRYAEIESILYVRAEQRQCLEKCGEVGWVYLVFVVFSFCSPWQRGMTGTYKASHLKQKLMTLESVTYVRFGLAYDNNDNQMTFVRHIVCLCPS